MVHGEFFRVEHIVQRTAPKGVCVRTCAVPPGLRPLPTLPRTYVLG